MTDKQIIIDGECLRCGAKTKKHILVCEKCTEEMGTVIAHKFTIDKQTREIKQLKKQLLRKEQELNKAKQIILQAIDDFSLEYGTPYYDKLLESAKSLGIEVKDYDKQLIINEDKFEKAENEPINQEAVNKFIEETDKFYVDDLDTRCPYHCSDKVGQCNNPSQETPHTYCIDNKDCIYKQYARKEQECEELKAELELFKTSNQTTIDQLKAENDELNKQLESTKGLVTVGNKKLAEALLELQKYKNREQWEIELNKKRADSFKEMRRMLYGKVEGSSLIEKRNPYEN